MKKEEENSTNKIKLNEIKGEVEFKNVNFSYSDTKNIITNLSLVANPGDIIGVIGGTGSGKAQSST